RGREGAGGLGGDGGAGLATSAGLARRPARRGGRMMPVRWRQIDDLFDAAVRIDPAGREPWLRAACGGDEELRAEVGRLLAQDERADRVGFLTPPEPTGPPTEGTTSWPARAEAHTPESGPAGRPGAAPADGTGGLPPTQALPA